MINLKLTPAQAEELAWLLEGMNIEPVAIGKTLIEILDQPVDHPLWPVLAQLRSARMFQPATTATCICGKEIERSTRGGQPKKYCSAACKQRSTRQREFERKRRALMRRP